MHQVYAAAILRRGPPAGRSRLLSAPLSRHV